MTYGTDKTLDFPRREFDVVETLHARELSSLQHKCDPFALYARLRAGSPIHRIRFGRKRRGWLVICYDEAKSALCDCRLGKRRASSGGDRESRFSRLMAGILGPLSRNMLDLDEPHHRRLRGIVAQAFTPAAISALRPRIQAIANQLVDCANHRNEPFELVTRFALPLPATVIAELLGVPVASRVAFARWSNAIVRGGASRWAMLNAIPKVCAFLRFIRQVVRARRRNPGDDMISLLIRAEMEGDRLTEDELIGMVFLLLVAGHETTTSVIANGVLALLEHPEQLKLLCRNQDLVPCAVEELLRFAGPLEFATERYARHDIELHGQLVRQGSLVLVGIASANRDDRAFDSPALLDVQRQHNPHIAFGFGPHYCLGAQLARLETTIALDVLLDRRLISPDRLPLQVAWRPGLFLRGLRALRIPACTRE